MTQSSCTGWRRKKTLKPRLKSIWPAVELTVTHTCSFFAPKWRSAAHEWPSIGRGKIHSWTKWFYKILWAEMLSTATYVRHKRIHLAFSVEDTPITCREALLYFHPISYCSRLNVAVQALVALWNLGLLQPLSNGFLVHWLKVLICYTRKLTSKWVANLLCSTRMQDDYPSRNIW